METIARCSRAIAITAAIFLVATTIPGDTSRNDFPL
jgi:hypothetical protein